MVPDNTERHRTAFLVSVDYTRAPAPESVPATVPPPSGRWRTRDLDPADLARPGHVMPLLAKPGGVLERPGHTEAGVDLCKMAGSERGSAAVRDCHTRPA